MVTAANSIETFFLDQIDNLAQQLAEFHPVTRSDDAVELRNAPGKPPFFRILRTSEGIISPPEASPSLPYQTNIPFVPDPTGSFAQLGHLSQYTELVRNLADTSRRALVALPLHHFHENFCSEAELCPQASQLVPVTELLRRIPVNLRYKFGRDGKTQRLEHEIHAALVSIADPAVWQICHAMNTRVLREGYNAVAGNKDVVKSILETNPGVAGWYFARVNQEFPEYDITPLEHPSQLISLVRQDLNERGFLDKRVWKTLVGMNPRVVSSLLRDHAYNTSQVIKSVLRAGATPSRAVMKYAVDNLLSSYEYRHGDLDPVVRSLYRESERRSQLRRGDETGSTQNALVQDADYVFDWAFALKRTRTPIRAKTWKGCQKAAEKWHRQHAEQELENQRVQLLQKNNGSYSVWNSLVGPFFHDGLRVVPLTNDLDLSQEALTMKNCVDSYTTRCTSGHSRIFSVRNDETTLATGELRYSDTDERWSIAQVRSFRNGAAAPKANAAISEALRLYTQAWEKTNPEERNWSWTLTPDLIESARIPA